jgi:hypothetical protein
MPHLVRAEDAQDRAAVDQGVPEDARVDGDRARAQFGDEAEIIVDTDRGRGSDGQQKQQDV